MPLITDTRSPTKNAPQSASNEVSNSKDKEAIPATAFAIIGKKRFPVPTGYGGRLKLDQEKCDDMSAICKSRMREEIMACMSDPVKAKAHASSDKSKLHAVFVCVFATWV